MLSLADEILLLSLKSQLDIKQCAKKTAYNSYLNESGDVSKLCFVLKQIFQTEIDVIERQIRDLEKKSKTNES